MTAGRGRDALLPGLMALLVLVGASMAAASRPTVPDMVTRAKQVVFDGGSESASGPVSGAGPTATVSSGPSSGEAGGSQGRSGVGRYGHVPSGDHGGGSKGVGPMGVPTSHAGGNGKDHTGGNGNGKGTPPRDPGSEGHAPSPSGSPVKRHNPR